MLLEIAVYVVSLLIWQLLHTLSSRRPQLFLLLSNMSTFERLSSSVQIEWHTRVVSNLHAPIAIMGGCWCCFVQDGQGFTSPTHAAFGNTLPRSVFLIVTSAYLTYDFGQCLKHRKILGDSLTLVHHLIIVVAFTTGVATGTGTFFMGCFLLNEVSTLFLNANFFLACNPQRRNGPLYRANGVALLVSFFLCRVVFNWYMAYHLLVHTWLPLSHLLEPGVTPMTTVVLCAVLSCLALLHCLLNMAWFMLLAKAVARKLTRVSKVE